MGRTTQVVSRGVELASTLNLSNERLLHEACVVEGSPWGHTKSTYSRSNGGNLECTLVVDCAVDVQADRKSLDWGKLGTREFTWSAVAHTSRTTNKYSHVQGRDQGRLLTLYRSRCIRLIGVQSTDHPSLHEIRFLLIVRTAGTSFLRQIVPDWGE